MNTILNFLEALYEFFKVAKEAWKHRNVDGSKLRIQFDVSFVSDNNHSMN